MDTLGKAQPLNAMILPALEMLKQMDGIGWYNDNGVKDLVRQQPVAEEGETEQEQYQWW